MCSDEKKADTGTWAAKVAWGRGAGLQERPKMGKLHSILASQLK